MIKKKFLIVEDENSLSEIILKMLEAFEYEGKVARNATEAVRLLENTHYDAIILDLTLPDMNGIDLYRKIIKMDSKYRKRIIFTSGFETSKELDKLIKENELHFLSKPFTIDQFISVIDELMKNI